MAKQQKPYGLWSSPITPAHIGANHRLYDAQWDTHTAALIWQERRSDGAVLVAQLPGNAPRDLLRGERVGGELLFGGGGFTVGHGTVYYVGEGGRIYRLPITGGTPQPITPAFGRAAAPALSPDGRWILYVHSDEEREALVIAPTDGSSYPRKLLDDADFVMHPAWGPDGNRVACITWDHPHMPWDASRLVMLYLGSDVEPRVVGRSVIAGGDNNESVFGAAFSPDGNYLAYTSDRSGWWQLYAYDMTRNTRIQLTQDEAEYGLPAWLQDMRTFAWGSTDETLYTLRNADSTYTLQRVNVSDGTTTVVSGLDSYTHLEQIAVSPVSGEVSVIAGATHLPDRLVTVSPDDAAPPRVRAYTDTNALPISDLTQAQILTWRSPDGTPVSGMYYPPTNSRYTSDGRPPLVLYVHSGPTRQRFAQFFPQTHFFTTRGFAVLEPNYRGSTGYGRAFKDALNGAWGAGEVEDCTAGVAFLADAGMIDPARVIVIGESSGGFSVLQCLIQQPGHYRAGIAQAPVTDQFALARDTHKFERYYNDTLLGPLPEAAPLYRDRSPVFHASQIQTPVALFHGSQDTVVPPDQSARVAAALRRSGVPHIHRVYDGEGHSIRDAANVRDYYQSVLDFIIDHVIYA